MRLIDLDELLCRIRHAENEPFYYHDMETWLDGIITAEELITESPIVAVIPKEMNDVDEDITPEDVMKML